MLFVVFLVVGFELVFEVVELEVGLWDDGLVELFCCFLFFGFW